MPKYIDNLAPNTAPAQLGVILANLGTPESPSTSSVRRFLRQFLSDPRVVELPKWLWWFILNGIILVVRPRRSAQAYAKVWQDGGSPLMINARSQAEKLERLMNDNGTRHVVVRHAMRYGDPTIADTMDQMTAQGITQVLIISMYPQYSGSTSASIFDEIGDTMAKRRFVPDIRFMNGYANRTEYIECLARKVRQHWSDQEPAECLVMSFHGLPQEVCDAGDPYQSQCNETAELLASELKSHHWRICFQSRFGPKTWLQPYAEDVFTELTEQGIKSVDVLCPGFSVDCLETLEEVNMGYRELFLSSGGEVFNYIPCLNDSDEHIQMLSRFVHGAAGDWLKI